MLGSSEAHYTASKLYPALLAGRPILAIHHAESSVVEILRRAAPPPMARLITYTDAERRGVPRRHHLRRAVRADRPSGPRSGWIGEPQPEARRADTEVPASARATDTLRGVLRRRPGRNAGGDPGARARAHVAVRDGRSMIASHRPIRLTVVLTHPVQYYAPWFRHIAARCPEAGSDGPVRDRAHCRPARRGVRRVVSVGHAARRGLPMPHPARRAAGSERSQRTVLGPRRPRDRGGPRGEPSRRGPDPRVALRHAACGRSGRAAAPAFPPCTGAIRIWATGPTGWRGAVWGVRTRRLVHLFDGHLSVGTRAREYLTHFGVDPRRVFDAPHAVDNELFARTSSPHRVTGRADGGAGLLGARSPGLRRPLRRQARAEEAAAGPDPGDGPPRVARERARRGDGRADDGLPSWRRIAWGSALRGPAS